MYEIVICLPRGEQQEWRSNFPILPRIEHNVFFSQNQKAINVMPFLKSKKTIHVRNVVFTSYVREIAEPTQLPWPKRYFLINFWAEKIRLITAHIWKRMFLQLKRICKQCRYGYCAMFTSSSEYLHNYVPFIVNKVIILYSYLGVSFFVCKYPTLVWHCY